MIKVHEGYDPASKEMKAVRFNSEKQAMDVALTSLIELRGEMRMKTTKDGGTIAVTSKLGDGGRLKAANDIHAVPIYHRQSGEVRHMDLGEDQRNSKGNAAAHAQMRALLDGPWRLATADEQKAALAKDEADRARIQKEKDKALEMPAEKIGMAIGSKLTEFAAEMKKNK